MRVPRHGCLALFHSLLDPLGVPSFQTLRMSEGYLPEDAVTSRASPRGRALRYFLCCSFFSLSALCLQTCQTLCRKRGGRLPSKPIMDPALDPEVWFPFQRVRKCPGRGCLCLLPAPSAWTLGFRACLPAPV